MELGGRFWVGVLALVVGTVVAAYLIFALIGWAWYAWGLFGMLLVFGGALLFAAWLYDRREARRYESASDPTFTPEG